MVLLAPSDVRGVNYYPSRRAWERMWLNWDSAAIGTELALARNLGLNLAETYVHFPAVVRAEDGGVESRTLDRMERFLRIADATGLKVAFTLFDLLPSYSVDVWPIHARYLDSVVGRFKDDERICFWGVRNEINAVDEPLSVVSVWAESVISRIRRIDAVHPIELEFSSTSRSQLEASPIVKSLLNRVDLVGLSFYGHPESLAGVVNWLRSESATAIMVSEFGYPTSDSGGEQQQALVYEAMLRHLAELDIGFRFWTLVDFVEKRVPFRERTFGVYHADYSPKVAARILRRHLAGEQ